MNQNLNVSAKPLSIQIGLLLATYKKYVEYLEKVVELNPRDLDMELNLSKFDSILKDASPEVREAFLSKYRN